MRKYLLLFMVVIIAIFMTTCKPNNNDKDAPTILSITPDPITTTIGINGSQSIVILFNETISTSTLKVSGTMIPSNKTPQIVWSKTTYDNDTLTISPPVDSQWVDSGYGQLSLIIECRDPDDNYLKDSPVTIKYKVDTTPPVVSLMNTPETNTNSTSINISVSGLGIVSYKYLLDNPSGNWDSQTEIPHTVPISTEGLLEGPHNLKVRGKDAVGNWQLISEITDFSWTIDITPSTAIISNTPASITNSTSISVVVSGVDVLSYKYLLDDTINGWDWANAIEMTVTTSISKTGLAPGQHELRVIAKDPVGNWQGTAEDDGEGQPEYTFHIWTIDTTQNIATISNTPTNPTNNGSYNITVGGNGVVAYKHSFAESPVWSTINEVDISNPNITGTVTGDGMKTIKVIGKNALGTWQSTPTAYSWILDIARPQTPSITANPAARTNVNYNLNWQWSNVHSTDTGTPVTYRYKLDKTGEATPIVDWTATTQLTFTKSGSLPDGEYTFSVKSVDLAGNESLSVSTNVTIVDTTPPTATASPIDGSTIGYTQASIVITFDEEMNSSSYTLSGTLISGLVAGTDYTASWNPAKTVLTLTLISGKSWKTGSEKTLDLAGCKDLVGYNSTTIITYEVNLGSITTLFVRTSGSDSNNGTENYPKKTIQNAIDTLVGGGIISGGEVHIATGTYNVTAPISMAEGISLLGGYNGTDWSRYAYQTESDRSTNLTQIKYTGTSVGISTNPTSAVLISGSITSATILEGFTINGRSGVEYTSAVQCRAGSAVTIRYNTINGGSGSDSSNGIYCSSSPANISNNIIAGGSSITMSNGIYNYGSGITVNTNTISGGTGDTATGIFNISCSAGNIPTITNNTISGGGINTSSSRGIYNELLADGTITNNTITGGNDSLQSYGIYNYIALLTIDNNIITGGIGTQSIRTYGIYNTTSSDCIISANTIHGGKGASFSAGINNYQASPMIANNLIYGGDSVNANGIYNQVVSKPYIINNTINGGKENNAVGIYIVTGAAPFIINNIIFTDKTGAAGGAYCIFEYNTDADPSEVRNNDFYNGYLYYDNDSGTQIKTAITDTINNPPYTTGAVALNAASGVVSANVLVDPGFVSMKGSDNDSSTMEDNNWHLQASSPASVRTGGSNESSNPDFPKNGSSQPIDKDGTVRTVGWSIGAYEQN